MTRASGWLLIGAVVLVATGCSAQVAHGLAEDDANRVLVALDRAGVGASKEIDAAAEGRFVVTVARDDESRAVAILRDEELPSRASPGVLESVGKGSILPSATTERAQLVAGMAGDLEKTLVAVDGVVAARVHLSMPEPEPLLERPARKATASVLVKHHGATPPIDAGSVQKLVAGAVSGLAEADVAVVFAPRPALAATDRSLARVGPIAVARGSLGYLRGLIALAVLCSVMPTVALVAVWLRARRGEAPPPAE